LKTVLLFFLSIALLVHADRPIKKDEILECVFYHLSETGTLRQDRHGFVYVDVSDEYIYKTVDYLESEGFHLPPYFCGRDGHGAHITVISAEEARRKGVVIQEDGQPIFFKVKDCKIIASMREDVDAFCILTIEAPNLDAIRKKYGLGKYPYEYHITIGFRTRGLQDAA